MRPSSAQRQSCGNTLPGLSSAVGSKAHLRRCCWSRSISIEHRLHEIALLDADAVLAGQHAAHLDAQPQDLGAERLGALQLAGLVGVVQDQRMQVAVAGVEDVGDAQAVLLRHLAHPRSTRGSVLARDRAVHAVVVGRDAADRRERRLAPGPEQQRAPSSLWLVRTGRRAVAARRSPRPRRSGGRPRPRGRRARRSAAPRRRADSRRGRRPRRHGSPAGPSSPCRPG